MLDISDKQLKISYWIFNHQKDLKKGLVWALVVADIFVGLFFLSKLIPFLVQTPSYRSLFGDLTIQAIDFPAYKKQHPLRDLVIVETEAIPSKVDYYHLVAKIKNPNTEWAGEKILYTFQLPGQKTRSEETFILPQETKVLVLYNIYVQGGGTTPAVSLNLEKIQWKRYPKSSPYVKPQFAVTNTKQEIITTAADTTGPASLAQPTQRVLRVRSDIANQSVYAFWAVKVYTVLYGLRDGKQVITGINTTTLQEFLSQTSRTVDAAWTEPFPNASQIEIYQEINTLDTNSLMPFQSGQGQPL